MVLNKKATCVGNQLGYFKYCRLFSQSMVYISESNFLPGYRHNHMLYQVAYFKYRCNYEFIQKALYTLWQDASAYAT
jgi:hypothetical protein